MASKVPQTMPTSTAWKVMAREIFMPSQRKGKAPGMEDQSNSYMLFASDIARDGDAFFELVHQGHHGDVDDDVGQGHGDEGIEGLRRVIDQLAALGGQFEEADGGADGGVLE